MRHPDNPDSFASAREMLSDFALQQAAQLIPIYTNIRFLEEDAPGTYYTNLLVMQSFAACLASCAHAFSTRLTSLLIPSSHELMDLEPLGSHPLLDPNYSSASLNVLHDGLAYSRMDKMLLLKDWPESLAVLRVCADPLRSNDKINCGKCEKCLRTKISLLVMGILDRCPTFEDKDVTADDIDHLWTTAPKPEASAYGYLSYGSNHFWGMMVEPVKAMNRTDLAEAIEAKIAEYNLLENRGRYTRRIKYYDQKLLGGVLTKINRVLRGKRIK